MAKLFVEALELRGKRVLMRVRAGLGRGLRGVLGRPPSFDDVNALALAFRVA